MLRSTLLLAITLLIPAIVLAGTYYRYTTDSGSTAFADKLESVPERYREDAKEIPAQSIFDYERTTITEKQERDPLELAPTDDPNDFLMQPHRSAQVEGGVVIELDPGVRVTVPDDADGEPLRVHRRHYRGDVGEFTRTQITRNGKVLVDMTEDRDPYLKWDPDSVEMPDFRDED